MLTIRKVTSGNWYLEYNGRFVQSYDRKREAIADKKLMEKAGLIPA